MLFFDQQQLDEYQSHDRVLEMLRTLTAGDDATFTSQRWLLDSLPKRMIFHAMYGDLLETGAARKRVLDIGGGYSALTRRILEQHDYTCIDILAHDSAAAVREKEAELNRKFLVDLDWHEVPLDGHYNLVVANDVFPNVDQRLTLFLEKFLPCCDEIRVTLTYYPEPRWYRVTRAGADEILHVLAWDGARLKEALAPYAGQIAQPQLEKLMHYSPSLYNNQRQVAMATMHSAGEPS